MDRNIQISYQSLLLVVVRSIAYVKLLCQLLLKQVHYLPFKHYLHKIKENGSANNPTCYLEMMTWRKYIGGIFIISSSVQYAFYFLLIWTNVPLYYYFRANLCLINCVISKERYFHNVISIYSHHLYLKLWLNSLVRLTLFEINIFSNLGANAAGS